MKKLLTLALGLCMILTLAACGDSGNNPADNSNLPSGDTSVPSSSAGTQTPSQVETPTPSDEDGTYEGELDANGKFTRYGIWVYHNFRYEGYFVDGVPNGEGTLYHRTPNEWDNSITGKWVDGYAEGDISYYIFYINRNEGFTFNYSVTKGQSDAQVAAAEKSDYVMDMQYDVFGVPPFVNKKTDPTIPVPDGSGNKQPSTPDTSTATPDP